MSKINYLPIINTHFTVFGGHLEEVQPNWNWFPEEHPAFELIYILKGSQKTVTELGDIIINAGEFTLIPADTRHANYAMNNEKMEFFCIHFDLDSPTLRYLLIREYTNKIISDKDIIYNDLKKSVKKIINMIKADYSLIDKFTIQIDVISAIKILIRSFEDETSISIKGDMKKFTLCQKIANDIKEKIDYEIYHSEEHAKISVSDIIEKRHISQSYALKLFKSYYNLSPQEYAINLKLTDSKNLLLQPKAQINEISNKLGYSAQSHFSREFKKHFGLSPREYIRKFNTNSTN
ncbi:helix-turn-helix domain-containing protein [Dellaglioa sp. P0083]|uniref:AraC family transcriptional regulator n=1 Tax=Dellaglioa kimchii TaxID=3344667 RepID=UPI0038D3DD01